MQVLVNGVDEEELILQVCKKEEESIKDIWFMVNLSPFLAPEMIHPTH